MLHNECLFTTLQQHRAVSFANLGILLMRCSSAIQELLMGEGNNEWGKWKMNDREGAWLTFSMSKIDTLCN